MAVNKEVVSYIRSQIALGIPRTTIAENLRKVGWSDEVITESFVSLASPTSTPSEEGNSSTEVISTGQDVVPESVNSPYSSILSVVLIVSLFILTNGIFSDIKNMATSVNKILLFEGLFVVPFLLIAFLLHGSFKEDKKRFEILSYPYFVISFWIVLRLLFKVGQNIWEANNAFGVYIVLGMVVVSLTGIVIFIQRYIKK